MNSSQIACNHLFAMFREYFEREDCSGIFLNKKSPGLLMPLPLTKGNASSNYFSIVNYVKHTFNCLKISIQTIISSTKISYTTYDGECDENPAAGARCKTLYEYLSCYIKHSKSSSRLCLNIHCRGITPCLRHITLGIPFWRRADNTFYNNKGNQQALII